MKAAVISLGDELVSGQTVNTNASYLSSQLTALGIPTACQWTLGDDLAASIRVIRQAAAECPLVLITGGLGPTDDDLTRQAMAEALGETLVEDPQALADLEAFFRGLGRVMPPSNRVQALRPVSARCLKNSAGTAPGLQARLGSSLLFALPGVPREMKQMYQESVAPELALQTGGTITRLAKINTFGLAESVLGQQIKDLMVRGANPAVGTTVHDAMVSVRIYATGSATQSQTMVEAVEATLRQRLGHYVFGTGDETLAQVLAQELLARGESLALAESCTGGLAAKLMTDIPGVSGCFQRSWVVYSNQAKQEELGVDPQALAAHGAVSRQVAIEMARQARSKAAAHWGLGITGIAGPGGATPEKPVGRVWIGLAQGQEAEARMFDFPGNRSEIRQRAALMALALVRWKIRGFAP